MTGTWWSQKFAPEGSVSAEGIVRQLGQPAMDPLTVLVREAAQNSWDARDGSGPVQFRIAVERLGARAAAWRRLLLPRPAGPLPEPLDQGITPELVLITVSDRRTVGLGGPLRAGQRAKPGVKPDFVQFVRNVGEPRDHEFGGGTYGFGKGVFYRISRHGIVLIDSRSAGLEGPRRRLMGAALGPSWFDGEQRYTGRHWWGVIAPDDVPDPIIDTEADAVAAELGLPGFERELTGTDVVVVGADLGIVEDDDGPRPRDVREAATVMASSLLWHLWPKAVPDTAGAAMNFSVVAEGKEIPVPAPEQVIELQPFVAALTAVRQGRGHPFTRTVAPKHVGTLAVELAAAASNGPTSQVVEASRPVSPPTHHIARMRVAELIVDYHPGPPHPDPLFRYAGVFKVSEEADGAFALAEPPTHDGWVETGLSGSSRGAVQGARRFLQRQLDEQLGFAGQVSGGGDGLGELSARLSALVPNVAGPGASQFGDTGNSKKTTNRPDGSGNGSGGPLHGSRAGAARIVGSPSIAFADDLPYLAARVTVPASESPCTLIAEASVVLDGGGKETDRPTGAQTPTILHWRQLPSGSRIPGDTVTIEPGPETEWLVHATFVPDAVVRFSVKRVPAHAR